MNTKIHKRKIMPLLWVRKYAFIVAWSFASLSGSNAFCVKHHPHRGCKIPRIDDLSNVGVRRSLRCINLYRHSGKSADLVDKNEDGKASSSKETKHELKHTQISSRRIALQQFASSAAVLSLLPLTANAGVAQIDSKSGELFSPKKEMLGGGGSDLARGIKLQSRSRGERSSIGNGFGIDTSIQSVYDTRFITYLSRFLLNYDPAAVSWWDDQKFENNGKMSFESQKKLRFAEFAESVEVGLADYFLGPYGSYASVQAAMAGLSATKSVSSSSSDFALDLNSFFFDKLIGNNRSTLRNRIKSNEKGVSLARQGILNLFSLLKARYTSVEEKSQLALLFSLITDERLQPTAEIKGLLGEVDNGIITDVKLEGLLDVNAPLLEARGSSHCGGGYSVYEKPIVKVEAPPALGDGFIPAELEAVMNQTTRILRIRVLDGGEGYKSSPKVDVIQKGKGIKIPCESCAILDRNGSVESIIVLNPGLGYGGQDNDVEVRIAPPKKVSNTSRVAVAVAELEYSITDIKIINGGNGYIFSEPPKIDISVPQEEPDWYMVPIDKKLWQINDTKNKVEVSVHTMTSSISNESFVVDTMDMTPFLQLESNPLILKDLENDSTALFPSDLRPYFVKFDESGTKGTYCILSLPQEATKLLLPSQRYRAYDSVFGGVGAKPVLKGAQKLTTSEYVRIALSGGVCTVIVRTALNPLELVKTKIQIKNDKELMNEVKKSAISIDTREPFKESREGKEPKASTIDVIKALSRMRGPLSLFQSADITFLASSVFGSFGFGATELFRRFFTSLYFDGDGSSKGIEEITLLLAAAIACVVTSAAASPFELLRVRSMAYVDAKPVKTVFSDFLREQRLKSGESLSVSDIELGLRDMNTGDLKSLFSGFYPIVSRELPFAVVKFLAFDLIASSVLDLINSQPQIIEPIQVGVGPIGLAVSAGSGAIAGLFGALVSHPADLILTLTSSKRQSEDSSQNDWKDIVKELLSREGGVLNLFAGFPARASFFFLVIGLQFFLYDYAKTLFQVGSDDLTLVLDVFYAIRQGLESVN